MNVKLWGLSKGIISVKRGNSLLSPDWMITMKLLSPMLIFASSGFLWLLWSRSNLVCVCVFVHVLGGGRVSFHHVIIKAPCHVMLFWSLVRWSCAVYIPMGFVNAVSLWETASGTGRTCESLLNFTLWKRLGNCFFFFFFLFLFILSLCSQPASLQSVHALLPVSISCVPSDPQCHRVWFCHK